MTSPAPDPLVRAVLEKGFLRPEEFSARPALPAPAEEASGKPFGRYLVQRKIGEGGSSHVYLAVDPLLSRRVALKVLKSGLPEDAARFSREARLAAELRHPNIVPIYEVGQAGKELFLAMPYIEGRPLEPSGLGRDLPILLKVARALGVAHRLGMIHRDVKPWNVLVDAQGEPHLTDFGMAKRLDAGDGPLTRTGTLVGTPAFMSPEQARGEFRTLTAASDVFSLGATLYTLATRRLPFQGETMLEVVRKVIETEPIPAGKLNPEVPAPLEAILRKAMAKDPAARYPTANEFADDLERFLRRRPILAPRRRRTAIGLAAGGAILAAVALAVPGRRAAPEPALPSPERPRAAAALPEPPPAAPPEPSLPAAVPAPEPARPTLDPALRSRVKSGILDAPGPYVRVFLTEAEIGRARRLVGDGGGDEDRRFLERLDAEVVPRIERERRQLEAWATGHEPDRRRIEAPDLLRMKDGTSLQVRLEETGEASVTCLVAGRKREFPRSEVERVEPGGAPEMKFHEKLEAAGSGARALEALAEWCREEGLEREREYLHYRLLLADPGHVAARRELRLPLTGPLAEATPAPPPPPPSAPTVEFEGRAYAPEALRRELLDRGFVVLDGRWWAARPWTWAPRQYWTTRLLSVGGKDAVVQSWDEARVESAYDLDQKKLVRTTRWIPKFHFIGPELPRAPAGRVRATARLDVAAPGPLLECRIRAVCVVREGRGEIDLSAAVNGRPPVPLAVVASGTFSEARDASEALRGARTFSLVARIETDVAADADGRVRPFAFFLPGDAKDPEPLRIEGKVAEPRPDLDRLLPPR